MRRATTPAPPDALEREAGDAYTRECLELASDLEAPLVVWLGGWTRTGRVIAKPSNLRRTRCIARSRPRGRLGVQIAVEATSEISDVLENVGDTMRLLDAAGADPATSAACSSIRCPSCLRATTRAAQFVEAGDRLLHVHLQDLEGDRGPQRLPLLPRATAPA